MGRELRHDQLSDDPTLFEWLESNLVVEEGGAPPEAERHAAMVVLVHLVRTAALSRRRGGGRSCLTHTSCRAAQFCQVRAG